VYRLLFVVARQNAKSEATNHPRIEKAIRDPGSAINYMEKAPHDFGGYKAQAIQDSKKATLMGKQKIMKV
jgi:hypothetical protein